MMIGYASDVDPDTPYRGVCFVSLRVAPPKSDPIISVFFPYPFRPGFRPPPGLTSRCQRLFHYNPVFIMNFVYKR
ncbi:Uncharacterised protein [Salmonella enterica subsp. enterica serovar Bovismorbificans]|uniref:Uncharacterized protein n=1 Tax=Salmonella enterica subsp. enterica serovar Bovismorbificans TaxID=58097 RepID=A0A655BM13_SALET|nr:Uncharacterised protein [Salmonella enterica subsp. enterica serovar Bovismorbificans]